MKIRRLAALLLACFSLSLLVCPSSLRAKPKVDVQVRVNDGIGKDLPEDVPSRVGGGYMDGGFAGPQIFYLNVTLRSENKEAVAKNDGHWCIKGQTFLGSLTYHGTLSGSDLEVEVPQPNGKIKKMSFVIYDHKWRKLSDM